MDWAIRDRLDFMFNKLYEPYGFSDGETSVEVEKWTKYSRRRGPSDGPAEFRILLTPHGGDTIAKARTRGDSPRRVQVCPIGKGRYRDPTDPELVELRLRISELYDAVFAVKRHTKELTHRTRCYEFVHKYGYEKLGRVVDHRQLYDYDMYDYDTFDDGDDWQEQYEIWKREEGY